jgi:glutathione synthase
VRTLFVIDPIDTFNLQGDSSWMLMVETARRGWPQAWCLVTDLRVRDGRAVTQARALEVDVNAWSFRYDAEQEEPLDAFDVVWMRKDPPFNMDYIFATYILDLALKTTLILNDPRSIKASNEKMVALQWPEFCPPTLVTNRIPEIVAFAEAHDRIVLKPWDGNGGRGVLVTDRNDRNLRSMAELLTSEGKAYCIVQRYLPEVRQGDKRIILVDGEPMGWFHRVPAEGDHRGNMHVGATVHACELTARDQEICAAIGPRLKAEGLVFVGIDVIGEYMTEINVTSPTGLHEVRRLQGRNLEREIVSASFERRQRMLTP